MKEKQLRSPRRKGNGKVSILVAAIMAIVSIQTYYNFIKIQEQEIRESNGRVVAYNGRLSTEIENATHDNTNNNVGKVSLSKDATPDSTTNVVKTKSHKENGSVEWPHGCSSKCYLQNNPHLISTLGNDEIKIKEHWRGFGSKGPNSSSSCGCKVVLLAGPHKAASTTLQWISTVYSSMPNHPWQWLVPDHYFTENREWTQNKAFAPFMLTLYDTKDKSKNITYAELKDIYKNEFEKMVSQGKSVIFGSEEIDNVVDPDPKVDIDGIQEILDIIPSVESLSTLVVYRAPRIQHVKSHWKQVGWWHNHTFYEYLLQEMGSNSAIQKFYHSIDSLGIAAAFLKKNINVKILDMSGVQTEEDKEELYTIVGCDVLELECEVTEDNLRMPKSISSNSPKDKQKLLDSFVEPRNVKNDVNYHMNVTAKQMEEIDELFRQYDCNHMKWIKEGDHLKILKGKDIYKNMKECRTRFKDQPLSREDLFKSIRDLLMKPSNANDANVSNDADISPMKKIQLEDSTKNSRESELQL